MALRMVTMVLVLGGLLTGCGKHYWQADKRGVAEFQADSGLCIQEAKTKYGISETIYRGCMRTHGWRRVQTQYPTDLQFRGPEDEDDFLAPPDPLSARGPQQSPGGTVDAGQSPAGVSGDPSRLQYYTQRECQFHGGRWVDGQCRR
jgi:hypothetical protein